ncbi:MAG: hypothetical protein JKY42_12260 [Flavobacteriales bacterium]|nr:hypothetical protein [Flavobacteriales bacterium]
MAICDRTACSIQADNKIVCWGDNDKGQLEAPQPLIK